MNQLHKEFGLNPSIEYCRYCQEDGAIIFNGDNVPGQASNEVKVECLKRCIVRNMVVFIEMDGAKETGYVVCGPYKELSHIVEKPGPHLISASQLKKLMELDYRRGYDNKD